MAKRMLIDATHPEETRVVVLNGNRLEEFDFESSTKQQVKGNIYLAKVTRVEPSLQAAFVEYGGNRHGFLAFSEIHPDYFRIPVSDREAADDNGLHADPAAAATGAETTEDTGVPLAAALPESVAVSATPAEGEELAAEGLAHPEEPTIGDATSLEEPAENPAPVHEPPGFVADYPIASETVAPHTAGPDAASVHAPDAALAHTPGQGAAGADIGSAAESRAAAARAELPWEDVTPFVPAAPAPGLMLPVAEAAEPPEGVGDAVGYAALRSADAVADAAVEEEWTSAEASADPEEPAAPLPGLVNGDNGEAESIETIGGDEFDEAERQRSRAQRHYKIQEVIKRRQIMLVQVTKEERGNKGAALTTYLSLAGRYCVLMPNTARGGGVSRKITSITDRRRLKDVLEELDIPEGMGVIVRTAGAERSKAEIKRDYEYLLRLWNEVRELTLQSTAPASIYEEGNLIKRSIRDLYSRDIDEVLVEGEEGYRTAKAFMKMLMPSHAKRVQPYRDPQIGLLHRFQVESQIDAIHSPIVQLRSGGYVVINQTEALVAIDVNSGRSTRERNIEETALRTNLEAADEIARQLRLRDLAGLIVIDFIDMEEHRNQGAVERRLKDALKNDRARIQVGRISPFGLLEMSRQRLRPSLVEASTQPCPHCGGTGFIRSTESTALYVLRSIEEEGMRRRSAEVCVYVPTTVALYILNHKRDSLAQLETRYGVHVLIARDDTLIPPAFRLERLRAYEPGEAAPVAMQPLTQTPEPDDEDADDESVAGEAAADRHERDDDEERGRGRRRRRRRRRHDDDQDVASAARAVEDAGQTTSPQAATGGSRDPEEEREAAAGEDDRRGRRRGRGGGRRRGRRDEAAGPNFDDPRPASETVEIAVMPHPGETAPGDVVIEPAEAASAVIAPAEPGGAAIEPAAPGDVVIAPAEPGGAAIEPGSAAIEPAEPAGAAGLSWAAEPAAPSGNHANIAEPMAIGGAESLPALAGEAPSSEVRFEAAETTRSDGHVEHMVEKAVSPRLGHGDQPPPAADPDPESAPLAHAAAEPSEAEKEELGPRLAATPSDAEPASAAEPRLAADPPVQQQLAEKPATPRRGWWQRLIQS